MDNQLLPPDSPSPIFTPLPPPRRSRVPLIALAAVIILPVIAGGAFAYVRFTQSPERVVQKMIGQIEGVTSFAYAGEVRVTVDASDLSASSGGLLPATETTAANDFILSFAGATDIHDLNNILSSFVLRLTTNVMPEGQIGLGLESRTIGKLSFVKISDAPNLGFIDLSALGNQWIKIDMAALQKQLGVSTKQPQEPSLTTEEATKIKTILREVNLFTITKQLRGETIEGQTTHHYAFALNKAEVKKVIVDIYQTQESEAWSPQQLTALDNWLAATTLPDGEIWIGKNDSLPYKITLQATDLNLGLSFPINKLAITLTFKNFNQPISVDAPSPSVPLEEVLSKFFGEFLGVSQLNNQESIEDQNLTKDTDGDTLTDRMEISYGTDPKLTDSDGDGFSDGEEIRNGFNPNGPGKLDVPTLDFDN